MAETDMLEKYFYKDINKYFEHIDKLNINMAVMIKQHEDIQKSLEKITVSLEKLEERLEILEKDRQQEVSANETKSNIIKLVLKYWWALIMVIFYFVSKDTLFLDKILDLKILS